MAGLEGIRACVFDAYGTLFDVSSPVQKLTLEIGDKAADLARLWRQKQLEYTWLRSLMGVHADFWHVTGDALDFSLEALKIEDPGLRDELMTLYLKLDAYPEVAEALKALKAKGKRMAILSNGSPSMLDSAVRASGLEKFFDMVLSVEDVGIYKPSRRVYRHAMQKLQIQDAPSICFVSANSWDAQAAAQFGFQAVRLARSGGQDDRIPGKVTARIESLSELVALL
ncbi:MAG TPA: haloacid dehalogenase type II [Aestuariivirga sp.]|jgi:2-haloacid dehalogenase|nr:haloacid dehalogenase type II [Aestuariivirga sp.]